MTTQRLRQILASAQVREAFRICREASVHEEMLLAFFDAVWGQLDDLASYRTGSEAIFALKGRLLEMAHNPGEFVPDLFGPKPPPVQWEPPRVVRQLGLFGEDV
jgi:hypothetical protein